MARDLFHYAVRAALEKEKWVITDDPLKVGAGGAKFEIRLRLRDANDLGAERIVAADRGEERIAIEIKTFAGDSPITDYHAALGQFLNYRLALELNNIDRSLYLAIPTLIYEAFFQKEFLKISVERYQIKLIVYEPVNEVIERWIN
jgi:XisH protein